MDRADDALAAALADDRRRVVGIGGIERRQLSLKLRAAHKATALPIVLTPPANLVKACLDPYWPSDGVEDRRK